MRSRFIYEYFQIDTNRINSRGSLENMNRLEQWHHNGVIGLLMSDVAQSEALAGNDARRSRKAVGYIYSLTLEQTKDDQKREALLEQILFPKGCQSQSDFNDVRIVFNAGKHGDILVTNDGGSRRQPGGILGNRDTLARLGVRVMTDAEAVKLVEESIKERDQEAKEDANSTGEPLPFWVGRD